MRCGESSSSHDRTSLARSSMRPRMGYACCRMSASSGCRAWLTSRFGPQPARAHFDPRAHSKPLIRTTGAPRLRTSSTPIRWRRSYARSWPTKRNGGEAHPIFGANRSGWPKSPRALAGRLRRAQSFLRILGIEIVFGREGRLGMRTIRITATGENRFHNIVSTVSRVSDNGDGAGPNHPRPGMDRRFNCADDADDTDAKEPNPLLLLPAEFGRWHTESAGRFASPQRAFTGTPRDNGSSKR